MMTEVQRVARAIKSLASEHGVPNRFACHEIADYAALSNLRVGNLAFRRIDEIARESGFDLYREPDCDGYTYVGVQERETAAGKTPKQVERDMDFCCRLLGL